MPLADVDPGERVPGPGQRVPELGQASHRLLDLAGVARDEVPRILGLTEFVDLRGHAQQGTDLTLALPDRVHPGRARHVPEAPERVPGPGQQIPQPGHRLLSWPESTSMMGEVGSATCRPIVFRSSPACSMARRCASRERRADSAL
ncbi:hypothetical protein C3Y87_19400 [Carbonactinospora thermoautotrophica]|nr:hypothetical protein [Carbonactinospora thermoautotrophica]